MTRKALAGWAAFPSLAPRNSPREGQGPCSCGSSCFNMEARVTRNTPGPSARLLKDTQELDWGERRLGRTGVLRARPGRRRFPGPASVGRLPWPSVCPTLPLPRGGSRPGELCVPRGWVGDVHGTGEKT